MDISTTNVENARPNQASAKTLAKKKTQLEHILLCLYANIGLIKYVTQDLSILDPSLTW